MKKLTFLFLVVMLLGCSKSDVSTDPISQLPPETQTGVNTFGCLINGKILLPRDGSGTLGGADKGMKFFGGYPDGAYNEIDVKDFKSNRTGQILIHIHALRQVGVGNYLVDKSNGMSSIDGLNHNYIHCRIFNESTNSYQYYRSFDNSGVIKVTRYDLPNRIVSGTFTCKLRNSTNPNDEIEVSNGRFDLKWDILPDKQFP